MNADKIEIIKRERAYDGYFKIDRCRLRHRLFSGGTSAEIMREVFERGHAVAVILYDPDRDAVVLIDQFRIGALSAGFDPWVTEIVAGIIDPGETPEEVASRETTEEVVALERALQDLEAGRINTSLGIIALQWLALNRQKLRTRWSGPKA
jgi:ADP-ribose pyrophosphatase